MQNSSRLTTYSTVATQLALLSDRYLSELLETAEPIGSGIGGITVLLEMCGTRIFVKKVPLTQIEQQPENKMSTANVFNLPSFYQYGIGSAGFGVWREVAVHTMTTNWVLTGACPSFPLMYHWRVLPGSMSNSVTSEERKNLENTIEYWGGSSAIRARLEEIQRASAHVVLFMEYIPESLHEWLGNQLVSGDDAIDSASVMVDNNLKATTSFMNARGLLHFDAHFKNILTDGQSLYLTDFGLAIYSGFELSEEEPEFFERHRLYDQCYTMTHLVNAIVSHRFGAENRDVVLREYATANEKRILASSVESIIKRYAAVAVVMNGFFQKLRTGSMATTIYPREELERIYSKLDEFWKGGYKGDANKA